MENNLPETPNPEQRQTFKLVDARVTPHEGHGGCGCGGHGGGRGHGGGGRGNCGCGGKNTHPHAQTDALNTASQTAGSPDERRESPSGGCGCGGHRRSGGHGHGGGHGQHQGQRTSAQEAEVEELIVHSIPRSVRRAALFAAVDAIPVGENLQVVTPHQPDRLFDYLQQSDAHYRVESLETGPENWRYRITRLS